MFVRCVALAGLVPLYFSLDGVKNSFYQVVQLLSCGSVTIVTGALSPSLSVQVHVIRQAPFSLERDRTTAIQLEADMRRTPDNGGALSFRAWADGFVVYEARVYASDPVVSGGEKSGMCVEDILLHVLAATDGAGGDKKAGKNETLAATQHVLMGGVEIWGKRSAQNLEEKEEKEEEAMLENDLVVPRDVVHMSSMMENLRFVFVARY